MKHLRDAAPPRKESEIVRAVLVYLRTVPGVFAYRNNVGAVAAEHKGVRRFVRFGFPGMTDIAGWRHVSADTWPQPLYIEVKRPGAKLRPEQESFLLLARTRRCLAFVAYSVEDVQKALGL